MGDVNAGTRGVNRVATSPSVARSATTSIAGGSDVSEAAAKSTVIPSPSSTSTKRRSGGADTGRAAENRRTENKFAAPSARSPTRRTIFVRTMTP